MSKQPSLPILHYVLWAIFAAFAIGRFAVESHAPDFGPTGLFKTAAHFFTAGLIGYAIGAKDWVPGLIAVALTVIEVCAFFLTGGEL